MPQLSFPFDRNGMMVDVLLSCGGDRLKQLLDQNAPVPAPVWARGMIDTGTNVSAVSLTLLRQLGIEGGKEVKSEGIGGEFVTRSYEVSLTIADKAAPAGPTYSPPDVSVIHLDAAGVDVLIGLDLLMACRLVIDGRAGLFTLEF
jgi:hypothetical protein